MMIETNFSSNKAIQLPEVFCGSSDPWLALYTRGRHEKLVAKELQKKGIPHFLPLRKVSRHWSDRTKVIEEPLFQSYLFVQTSLLKRWEVLKTVGAVQFVSAGKGHPIEVPEKDLFSIKRFLEEEIQVDPFPYLKEGARVYVRSGPFKGVEGYIVRKDNHCRLVISLDVLMQSISVHMDQACVEAL